MTQVEAIKAVQKKLQLQKVKPWVITKVIKVLSKDLILPHIDLSINKNARVTVGVWPKEKNITVCIGPRDWSFTLGGSMTGCGTFLL